MKCIDTHIHTWDFKRAAYSWLDGNTTILNRNYLVGELQVELQEANVTEGVLVQAANSVEETHFMLEVAEQTPWLTGVVGWLPLTEPEKVAGILSGGYVQHRLFKGVRHLIHDEPDTQWLLQPPVLESLQLLAEAKIPYDAVGVRTAHLETLLKVLDAVPGLHLVLDHLNQPPIPQKEKFGRWGVLIHEIAKHPAAYAKISGLGTTTGKGRDWGAEDISPYVAFALQKFGADRCFCGGDWPVSLLAGSYTHTWNTYRQVLVRLLGEKQAGNVLYRNAKMFYQLESIE